MSLPAPVARAHVVRAIEELGVVAVIRLQDPARLRAVVDALVEGGVRTLELTMTVPGAIALIGKLAPVLPDGFLLGAGTVTDTMTAAAVIDAGARFVVSPTLRPDVMRLCHARDVAALPGCFSPTEIIAADDLGADMVKVFPATVLGPQFIRDVRAPFPHLKLMPTGGVTVENAGDWIRAGACAVGIGSALVDGSAVAANRFADITEKASRAVANVAEARLRR